MYLEFENVGVQPKEISVKFDPAEIDLGESDRHLASSAVLTGVASLSDSVVRIEGKIVCTIVLNCTRCLAPISQDLEIEFVDVFVAPTEEAESTESGLAIEDLDKSVAENGRIDLVELVREQILLNLKEQIYCMENCMGLCEKCGSNKNLINCNCNENELDPRWSALKDLI